MSLKIILAAAALATSTAAFAQDVDIERRAFVYSAEGKKIGRVESVVASDDGQPQAVKVIYRGRFVTIPASTLSNGEKGLQTTLTNDALRDM